LEEGYREKTKEERYIEVKKEIEKSSKRDRDRGKKGRARIEREWG
jgi:hypothetical protein